MSAYSGKCSLTLVEPRDYLFIHVRMHLFVKHLLEICYGPGTVIKAEICCLGNKMLSNHRGEREEKGSPGQDGEF